MERLGAQRRQQRPENRFFRIFTPDDQVVALFLQRNKIQFLHLQRSFFDSQADIGLTTGHAAGNSQVAHFFFSVSIDPVPVDVIDPQFLVQQHPRAGSAFAIDKPDFLSAQVGPVQDLLGISFMHIKPFGAIHQIDDDGAMPRQQPADIRRVVTVAVAVPQVGGHRVGLAVVEGQQPVDAADEVAQQADMRQLFLQMAGQNVERRVLPAED